LSSQNGHEFNEDHSSALRNLVNDRNFSIANALAEIDGLSKNQAYGVTNSLSRSDVLPLSNFWHITTLTALKKKGLTAQMLLNRNENGHAFNEHHSWALRNLVADRNFSIVNALAEIDGLSKSQAEGIKEGLSRSDVLPLSNFWHLAALTELKKKGLTAQMLLNRNENGHAFNVHHCWALLNLVKKRDFSIDDALAQIDGLSQQQAERIEEGETREQVLQTFNLIH
jgi:hypothetical protein